VIAIMIAAMIVAAVVMPVAGMARPVLAASGHAEPGQNQHGGKSSGLGTHDTLL
jgi:hypothetical protein